MPEYKISFLHNCSLNGDQEKPYFFGIDDFELDSDEENINLDEL